ncbi:MAG: zinc-binding dehydrogenase, partial [Lewinella sp.]|nr:zinc-binding dehydrogenase [Lewinella sp.]
PTPDDFRLLIDLAAEGVIVPAIDRTYRLAEIPEAHRRAETGRKKGNLVVVPALG